MTPYRSHWPYQAPHELGALPPTNIDSIKTMIARKYDITVNGLEGPERRRRFAWPRQEAFVLAYAEGRYSLPFIGSKFGGRDHTTVLYGIRACLRRHEEGRRLPDIKRARVAAQNQHLVALCRALAQQEVA